MLTHLSIRNFAIVDWLELDLPGGMTVITGETGAGKSIMLGALSLATGARADTDWIKTGCNRAEILATFDLQNLPLADTWLKERQLDSDDECILRRVIARDGRGRGYINGTPSPLGHLRELGELLVDIHAQHECQSLLRADCHRRLLDEFTGCNGLATQVYNCWQQWKSLQRQIEHLQMIGREQNARIQLLQYQVAELNQLALFKGEIETLEREQKQLASAEITLHSCQQVINLCSDDEPHGDYGGNILHSLTRCQQLLVDLNLPVFEETINLLANAHIQVEEAISEVGRIVESVPVDPARLAHVEQRLSAAYSLARKHGVGAEALPTRHAEMQRELEGLESSDQSIAQLQEQLVSMEQSWFELAKELSDHRHRGAAELNKAVSQHIQALGMPAGRFQVELVCPNPFNQQEPRSQGLEDIRFLVSTNPGDKPRTLDKIASGGELSRISLAIQVITAKTSGISTLVFDEVDVGIGGGTAEIVGRLLQELGSQGQVLCVTHQPQVASQGHTHLHVRKIVDEDSTSTQITALQGEARTQEVARMLGGVEMTEQTLAHAREMISRAGPVTMLG